MKLKAFNTNDFHYNLLQKLLFTFNIILLTMFSILSIFSIISKQTNLSTLTFLAIALISISIILQLLNLYTSASLITLCTLTIASYGALLNRPVNSDELLYLFISYQSIAIVGSGILSKNRYTYISLGILSTSLLILYIFTKLIPTLGIQNNIVIIGSCVLLTTFTLLSHIIYNFTGGIVKKYYDQQMIIQDIRNKLQNITEMYTDNNDYNKQFDELENKNENISVQIYDTIYKFIEDINEFNQLLKDVYVKNEHTVTSTNNILTVFNKQQNNMSSYKNKMDSISENSQDIILIAQNNKFHMNQLIELSEEGTNHIQDSIIAVEKISENSKNMVDMISLIMEVAEKTNILALNAAVEASRAGKYGGGFAIVAKEIKTLSTETTTNADIINQSLQYNIKSISETVDIIKNVGVSFSHLNTNIKKFSSTIDEISVKINNLTEKNSEMTIETKNSLALIREVRNVLEQNINAIQQGQNKIQEIQNFSKNIEINSSHLKQAVSNISQTNRKTQEKYREYSYFVKKMDNIIIDSHQ